MPTQSSNVTAGPQNPPQVQRDHKDSGRHCLGRRKQQNRYLGSRLSDQPHHHQRAAARSPKRVSWRASCRPQRPSPALQHTRPFVERVGSRRRPYRPCCPQPSTESTASGRLEAAGSTPIPLHMIPFATRRRPYPGPGARPTARAFKFGARPAWSSRLTPLRVTAGSSSLGWSRRK